mmetsp:Transcript_39488/g.104221  ORF Transcript_39488/g.104221 Transcript_39488/m.104221 type:complete len:243 (-) Transcript_39488:1007-1735(-)
MNGVHSCGLDGDAVLNELDARGLEGLKSGGGTHRISLRGGTCSGHLSTLWCSRERLLVSDTLLRFRPQWRMNLVGVELRIVQMSLFTRGLQCAQTSVLDPMRPTWLSATMFGPDSWTVFGLLFLKDMRLVCSPVQLLFWRAQSELRKTVRMEHLSTLWCSRKRLLVSDTLLQFRPLRSGPTCLHLCLGDEGVHGIVDLRSDGRVDGNECLDHSKDERPTLLGTGHLVQRMVILAVVFRRDLE